MFFDRYFPFVLYEEPSVAKFRKTYGEAPRELADDEPRWVHHGGSDAIRRTGSVILELTQLYYYTIA